MLTMRLSLILVHQVKQHFFFFNCSCNLIFNSFHINITKRVICKPEKQNTFIGGKNVKTWDDSSQSPCVGSVAEIILFENRGDKCSYKNN